MRRNSFAPCWGRTGLHNGCLRHANGNLRRANVLSQSWSNDKDQMVPHGLRWSSKFTLTVTVTVTTSILGAALCTIPQVSFVCVCVCLYLCVCLVFICIHPKQNCVTFALPSALLCSRATSSLGFLHYNSGYNFVNFPR